MKNPFQYIKNTNGMQKFNLVVACFCFITIFTNLATGSPWWSLLQAALCVLNIAVMFANATEQTAPSMTAGGSDTTAK